MWEQPTERPGGSEVQSRSCCRVAEQTATAGGCALSTHPSAALGSLDLTLADRGCSGQAPVIPPLPDPRPRPGSVSQMFGLMTKMVWSMSVNCFYWSR